MISASRAFLVALALVWLSPHPGAAQLTLKGGVNLATFFGDDVDEAESVRGLNLGGSFGLFGLGPVQLLGEVYYRQKGAEGGVEAFQQGVATARAVEVGIDYVEIPLLARIDLGAGGRRFVPYLQGGPAFGWQLECGVRVSGEGEGETACDDLTENFEETLRDYEMGAVVGAGVDIAVLGGLGALNLDARYTHGLSRIGEGENGIDVRNRAFTLMLGWSFGSGLGSMGGMGGPMR